jgi:hypothetical protein
METLPVTTRFANVLTPLDALTLIFNAPTVVPSDLNKLIVSPCAVIEVIPEILFGRMTVIWVHSPPLFFTI